MMRTVTLCAVLVALVGCKDRGECLKSHTETQYYLMNVGDVWFLQPQYNLVCDAWEYPNGKPEATAVKG